MGGYLGDELTKWRGDATSPNPKRETVRVGCTRSRTAIRHGSSPLPINSERELVQVRHVSNKLVVYHPCSRHHHV